MIPALSCMGSGVCNGKGCGGVVAGRIDFSVLDSAAWAPGLTSPGQWRQWALAPWLPAADAVPALAEVPPMQRRRLELLGRMAVQAALWCEGAQAGQPLVFASRHGDVERSLRLLETLARDEPMSPTAFGLSVHNAVAALYSIVRGERANYLALAAGQATVEAACVEAAGLLADGAREVRVVAYEACLPELFRGLVDEPECGFAWCWRLAAAGRGGQSLRLEWDLPGVDPATACQALPHALDVHRFLLSSQASLEHADGDGGHWRWSRHA